MLKSTVKRVSSADSELSEAEPFAGVSGSMELVSFGAKARILRPAFRRAEPGAPEIASAPVEIAEFYHAPPKPIAVEDGVRPRIAGKFIFVGDEKFYMRGVTYGPFHPEEDGCEYHTPELVEKDFSLMAESGINAVRTYTVPPRWLLDIAQKHGLRVMVGLPWEEHITFLDSRKLALDIERRVREGVRACAGHPALLCITIGNEIPASIVRWYGHRRIEDFLKRLYNAVKNEDSEALVTYVNFPTTEYLDLPFLDFVSFNVYLETREKLEGYLARLQNIAGDRPLLMAEVGYDSIRNGEDAQAATLDWQIRSTFAAGCAGVFLFSWTDEWYRGGFDITDWGFGLTDRDRNPKPSLITLRKAFRDVPIRPDLDWPQISVVVCSYNGSRTIGDCLDGLKKLEYPNFEVIVVNDGSKDNTEAIAMEFGFKVITTENQGLSSARNTGMHAAKGEIVAYIDDDARPDPHWLTYLAVTFLNTNHAGVGGPNIPPPNDGMVADCVASSPGGPIHVLLTDVMAEHIPGCNMAFRKEALLAVGGFDSQFHIAGDDVDVCWKLQQRGWTLGFSPAAMVWHHRRNSVKTYLKQQLNYGKAEADLEKKWPEKYNAAGHVPWAGRMYFKGCEQFLSWFRGRIYQGTWGSALFQSIYQPAPSLLWSLPLMPEWYLLVAALGGLSLLGFQWKPLMVAFPLLVAAIVLPILHVAMSAAKTTFPTPAKTRGEDVKRRMLTAALHLLQPIARLSGRIRLGLTPWRTCGVPGISVPWPYPKSFTIWSEQWQDGLTWLESLESGLKKLRGIVMRGGDFDHWDLELRGGLVGCARLLMAVEEHGGGKQLVRFRVWPKCSIAWLVAALALGAVATRAALDGAWVACAGLDSLALLIIVQMFRECASAMHTIGKALGPVAEKKE